MSERQPGAPDDELPDSPSAKQVMRYYELVDANDVTGLVDLFTADAVYHRPGYQPLRGRDELMRFYTDERVISSGHHTVTTMVLSGSQAAVNGEFSGSLRDGREVSLRFADFFAIGPEGRFCRRDTFFFAPMV
ncbi:MULTISPECIES: nuclear transport factor 2 family protein [unclassified Streptomyces]|uniref:nuclear transport factor 2 family protein n=1 Tax=unclassified Streptomyces TaxID=2593676 RepID=UPI0036E12F5A